MKYNGSSFREFVTLRNDRIFESCVHFRLNFKEDLEHPAEWKIGIDGAVILTFWCSSMLRGSRFKVQGSGFKVWGSKFGIQGSGFKVWGSGFKVWGSGFRV